MDIPVDQSGRMAACGSAGKAAPHIPAGDSPVKGNITMPVEVRWHISLTLLKEPIGRPAANNDAGASSGTGPTAVANDWCRGRRPKRVSAAK
jgi:hypothetical protein